MFNVATLQRRCKVASFADRLRIAADLIDGLAADTEQARVILTAVRAGLIVSNVLRGLTNAIDEGTQVRKHDPYVG